MGTHICLRFGTVCSFRYILTVLGHTPSKKKLDYENIWNKSKTQKHTFNYSYPYVLEHRGFSLPIDSRNFILSPEKNGYMGIHAPSSKHKGTYFMRKRLYFAHFIPVGNAPFSHQPYRCLLATLCFDRFSS